MSKPVAFLILLLLSFTNEAVAQRRRYTVREGAGNVIQYISRDGQTICNHYPAHARNVRRNATVAIRRYVEVGGGDERTWTRIRELRPNEGEFEDARFNSCLDFLDGIITAQEYRLQRRALNALLTRLDGSPAAQPQSVAPSRTRAEAVSGSSRPSVTPTSGNTPNYRLYQDPTSGFTIYYPAHLVVPQGEAVTGNGETFLSRDGTLRMRVYGVRGPRDGLPAARTRVRQQFSQITYDAGGSTWFAISGYDLRGWVIYEKHAWTDGVRRVLRFEYPASAKALTDPVVEIVERSFRQAPLQ